MTAELCPNGTSLAPARVATKSEYRRVDWLRWTEYQRLLRFDIDPIDAWELVAFHERIGIGWMIAARARGELRPAELLRSHDRFLKRIDRLSGDAVQNAIRATVRARGVEIARALVGSALAGDVQAQKHALALSGVVAPTNASGVTVNGPAQFNFAELAKAQPRDG